MIRAVEQRDAEKLFDLYHDEVEFHEAPSLPYGGSSRGKDYLLENANVGRGSGGRRLELVFEDTHGDPDAGVEALRRLHAAGACALVDEFHTGDANA